MIYYSKIVLILLLFCYVALGQSTKKIYGYVYDYNSGKPLSGTNIILNGTNGGTSTDEFGYYQFDNLLTGSYSISVSYIGYISKFISDISVYSDQPTEQKIYLKQSILELNEIVISSKNNYNLPIGTPQIFTSEEIEKNNFQSIGELLQQAPGIEIQATGGIGSPQKISIRGSETNQVLVLLDGIPFNNQLTGSADLSIIPTNIIERVEIYEGSNSAKFGSGAIGGVINIITKKNLTNENKINFTAGSYGFLNFEPSISGNIKKIGYYLSYNITKSIGDYPYTYNNTAGDIEEEIRINSDIKSQNIFSRLNYTLDKYLFSFNLQWMESDRGIPGKTNALTAYMRSKNSNLGLGYDFKAAFDKIVFNFNANYSQSQTDISNLYPDDAPIKYKRYPRYHYEYNSDITVINSTLHYKPSSIMYLTTGYNGKWLFYNDENFQQTNNSAINSAKDNSHGIFLHQDLKFDLAKPFNEFSLSPSIRYDEIRMSSDNLHRFENQWSPSLSVYTSMGETYQLFLKMGISRSFRAPTFSDLFYQDVRIQGKPDLLPEKSINKEFGIGWTINRWGIIKGEINLYKYFIEDMIVWKLGSFEVFTPFNNDAEISGQDYSLQYELPNYGLNFQINYTYLQPLDKNNQQTTHNKIIPYKPQHSLKANFNYNYKEFNGSIRYRIVGKRFVTVANTVELAPYSVIDLNASQNINIGRLKTIFKFSINNLTNEIYEIVRSYPIPGREYRLGLTLIY